MRTLLYGVVFLILLLAAWAYRRSDHLWVLLVLLSVLLLTILKRSFRYAFRGVRDSLIESPLERMLAKELRRQNIPFEREYRIGRCHVDFAFLEAKLAVECDGYRYHGSGAQRERDGARDAFLRRRGWRVLRFTGSQLRSDVRACVRKIRASL